MQIGQSVRDAISFFTLSLIAGDLGPDDSRDGRAQLFLKDPSIASQAMSVFLHCLQTDEAGDVANHDEAEERVRQYIEWKAFNERPKTPFTDDELGIRGL